MFSFYPILSYLGRGRQGTFHENCLQDALTWTKCWTTSCPPPPLPHPVKCICPKKHSAVCSPSALLFAQHEATVSWQRCCHPGLTNKWPEQGWIKGFHGDKAAVGSLIPSDPMPAGESGFGGQNQSASPRRHTSPKNYSLMREIIMELHWTDGGNEDRMKGETHWDVSHPKKPPTPRSSV